MNELTKPQIGVADGQVKFENVDQFKKDFEQILNRHSNFIVTEETLRGATKSRADLRNAAKESAAWRSKVKTELLKPFEDVSEIAIAYEKRAKDAADDIDKDVKVFDELEKQKRRDGLNEWLTQRADELDVSPDIEINDKWFIKGNFNGTRPKLAFVEEHLEPQLDLLVKAKAQRATDTIAIRNYAENKSFDPEGYIHSLDYKSLAEIMLDIDNDVVKRDKRLEAARAVIEMTAEKERQQHTAEVTVADKVVDTETGEVIAEAPRQVLTPPIVDVQSSPMPAQTATVNEPRFTRLLYVTGTVEDLQAVDTFMNANEFEFRGES